MARTGHAEGGGLQEAVAEGARRGRRAQGLRRATAGRVGQPLPGASAPGGLEREPQLLG
jgi:hypothetical protein